MLNLSGWVGDPGIASDAARRALLDPDVAGASPALPSAVGANWGCCGPYLSQQGSISVVLRVALRPLSQSLGDDAQAEDEDV